MDEARYPYLHIDVRPEQVEEISSLFWEAGAQGVEERDAVTMSPGEADGGHVTLVASFESEAQAAAARELPELSGARLQFVLGDAWREGWRAWFKPTRLGQRLVVRPSWEPFEAGSNDVVITVDPGNAFGTGTHESTRLLLMELDRRVRGGEALLDVGCGSGILSIAALRLGADSATCVDIDTDAVRVSLENAALNGVADRLGASTRAVADLDGRFPLVLANIQADVLIGMAEALAARVAEGGLLMLSGVLVPQRDAVLAAFGSLETVATPVEGEWVGIVLSRR